MVYKVTLRKMETYYIIDPSCESEARLAAIERFKDASTHIDCEALVPCQVNGTCPYDYGYSCNLCMEGEH